MSELIRLADFFKYSDALRRIKQLEADSGNWEAAYKTCAKSEDKLIEENQRLREAINKLIEEYNHETFSIKDLLKLRTREGL